MRDDSILKHGGALVFYLTVANFFNYLYQMAMGRLLAPEEYGAFLALASMLYLFSYATNNLITASIAKFVSIYAVRHEYGKIKFVWISFVKKSVFLGIIIFAINSFFSPFIAKFLNINEISWVIAAFLSLTFSFALPVNFGVLQGEERFLVFGVSKSLWAVFRLICGIVLVYYFGMGILGAVFPFFLVNLVFFLITALFLKNILAYESTPAEIGSIYSYFGPAFVGISGFIALITLDAILARHYLTPLPAGNYAAVSVLGKVVFFAPIGIALAMFPKVSKAHELKESHINILLKAAVFLTAIAGFIVALYWLFPEHIIPLLFGKAYVHAIPYAGRYGLAMLFFALGYLFVMYLLSINRREVVYPVLLTAVAEVALISLNHGSILAIVNDVLISAVLSLLLISWLVISSL